MSSGRPRFDQKPSDSPEITPDPRVATKVGAAAKSFYSLEVLMFPAKTL